MNEEWRTVPGFEAYQVSSLGRVRRRRILAGFLDSDGYRRISTCIKGKVRQVPVHTLVLLAFEGPRPTPDHQGAHGDGNKLNNVPGNLRWATPLDQAHDKVLHGTQIAGDRHPRAILRSTDIPDILRKHSKGTTQVDLADEYGVSRYSIWRVVHRLGWGLAA